MKAKIDEVLKNLPKKSVVLTILPAEHYEELHLHLVKSMTGRKSGAYVTLQRPYDNLINLMGSKKINHKNMLFIDCVTQKEHDAPNCVFLKSPQSLTNISVMLDRVYKTPELSFLFLDSLDALSLYHDSNLIVRFARSVINQIRDHEMDGVMLGLHEETDRKIIDELSMVCDKVIDLT